MVAGDDDLRVQRRDPVQIVDPVLTHGTEDVNHYRILQHGDAVLDSTWNLQHFVLTNDHLPPVDVEPQRAAQHTRDLLLIVRVPRHDAAFFQLELRDGEAISGDEPAENRRRDRF